MFVMVPLAHNCILIGTATQCYLFCCGFQPINKLLSLAWVSSTSDPLVCMQLPQLVLFKMKRKFGMGFYSTPVDGQ